MDYARLRAVFGGGKTFSHGLGHSSFPTEMGCPRNVRSSPDIDRCLRAKSTSCRSIRRLIRHEIKVAAQRVLDSERGTCRRIGIGSTSGYHAQGPVALGMAIGDAIYCDARYTRTTGLFSNFF